MCLAFMAAALTATGQPLPALQIKSVTFAGNRAVPAAALRPLVQSTLPDSISLTADAARLSASYKQAGYLLFRIDSLQTFVLPDSTGINLTVHLTEGPLWLTARVVFVYADFSNAFSDRVTPENETPQSAADKELYMNLISVREGDPVNEARLEKDIEALLKEFESRGRPFARIRILSISPEGNDSLQMDGGTNPVVKCVITLGIDVGKPVRVAGFRITGNAITAEPVILRELQLKAGDLFSEEKFSEIPARLLKLGFFERVAVPELLTLASSPPLAATDTLEAIVRFEVSEGNTNNFDGVIGYQPPVGESDQGFLTGLVNISLRNMFGSGRRLDVRWVKPNAPTQEIRLRYQEPWLLGVPLTLSIDVHQQKQDSSFSLLRLGLDASYRLAENFSIAASLLTEDITPILSEGRITQLVLQTSTLFTGIGLVYDSRDFPPSPQSGLLLRNDYRVGTRSVTASDSVITAQNLIRNLTLQRFQIDAEVYQRTFPRQVAVAAMHAWALVSPQIDYGDLFRFGGATTLRGYREQQFLASQLIYFNFEYRFLLSRRTFVFGFYDIGYYYKPPLRTVSAEFPEPEFAAWRRGAGFGARVESPLGILSVSYALGDGDNLLRGKVHFGLQNDF